MVQRKTLYNRYVRWAAKGVWVGLFQNARPSRRPTRPSSHRFVGREGPPLGGGWKRGEQNQAIGRSRGGRTTKIHALTDALCRPIAFMLTGGQVADCLAGALLLEQLPDCDILHADKGYDSNAIRRQVRDRGAWANIPPKANRTWKNAFAVSLPQPQRHRAHVLPY